MSKQCSDDCWIKIRHGCENCVCDKCDGDCSQCIYADMQEEG
jgi:hypothetical protein